MFQPMNLVNDFGFGIEQSRNPIAELVRTICFCDFACIYTSGDVHSSVLDYIESFGIWIWDRFYNVTIYEA